MTSHSDAGWFEGAELSDFTGDIPGMFICMAFAEGAGDEDIGVHAAFLG